ncbi:nuclear transport factor 2 family protein [Nocardia wallacei]|uniref:nuclear transport factor 2 family protein n=1 Tax=Nocardia wallacei TaxID=480035 RepID=UPI002457A67C|nr:nuclear transport factor 2 family protein [Nocardia wallacei]
MDNDGAAAEVRTVALDWARAVVSDDADRIAAFMAADWVMVSATGIATREQFLALVESGDLTHAAMTAASEPRIRVYGDTAVYIARVTNTAHYRGRRHDADEWTTDVFVRREGRWRRVASHVTDVAPG